MEIYKYTPHNISILLISILLFISYTNPASSATTPQVPKVYTNFIKSSCNTTTYPLLCIKTLTPYASKVKTSSLKLCDTALKVATEAARNASKTVLNEAKREGITSIEKAILRDCKENMDDAVYALKQTSEAMDHLEDADKDYQWANAKTYASAVITDTDTCFEGFSGRKVNGDMKKTVIISVFNVERLTSNALSLINGLY